ncbi:hypothetical protein Nepgr_007863 [Nepenthes gracilis]|uniref:Uncharacterized protein n=1 Tax=Nepenthes gracilis TaxID=150966 RepID=A0AAD3S7T5_NEPGR|nr:hypothetical protein Nepgr_007863 [Nepenthes gracilis]
MLWLIISESRSTTEMVTLQTKRAPIRVPLPINFFLVVAPKNLTPGVIPVGCGYPFSLDGHHAGDNSQCLNLNHAVTSAEPEAANANNKVPVDTMPLKRAPALPLVKTLPAGLDLSQSLYPADADAPSAPGAVCSAVGSIGGLLSLVPMALVANWLTAPN